MSFTRLEYDTCAYAKKLQESSTPLEYLLFKGKYENQKQCADHANYIDFAAKTQLESELRNQTRFSSKCPSKKYDPTKPMTGIKVSNPRICERVPSGLKKPTQNAYDESPIKDECC